MTKEIRKNLITLVAALAMACAATAQSKWGIVPQVGINSTVHSSNFPNWETKRGFVVEQTVHYYPFGAVYSDAGTDDALQPYKYNGKELDRMHGLNQYDYGARNYDPLLCRFTQLDPMAENYYETSPYTYCYNNPVRFFDFFGEAPGDIFWSLDDAAKDFGLFYNDNSIRENREYASYIFAVKDKDGNVGFSYSIAFLGINKEVNLRSEIGAENVATIHSHAAYDPQFDNGNDVFSGVYNKETRELLSSDQKKEVRYLDIGNANKRQMISYLVTPSGSLQKYNPKTGRITVISNEMPSDIKDPYRQNVIDVEEHMPVSTIDLIRMQDNINLGILYNRIK